MKNRFLHFILCFAVLAGCVQPQNNQTISQTKMEEYEIYYNAILENTDFLSESEYFSVSAEMSQVEDGTYRYYVFIDDVQVAMYQCIAMIVENDVAYELTTKMMPTEGILDTGVHMVPGQYNLENGYAKGIMLSGESDASSINIKLMVKWYNMTYTQSYRQYLSFTITYKGNSNEE